MRILETLSVMVGFAALGVGVTSATADDDDGDREDRLRARLVGVQEVPSVSTPARGRFKAVIDEDAGVITYTLSYSDLQAPVQQAHIHFGQRHTNGGISAFLCTNLGNGPAGTQACPNAPAEISGAITSADVVGPAGQGIAAGEFAELVAALRSGAAYANVHTNTFPGGEIRGQIHAD